MFYRIVLVYDCSIVNQSDHQISQSIKGNSSSMVEHSIVVGDTSVRFCGFAHYQVDHQNVMYRSRVINASHCIVLSFSSYHRIVVSFQDYQNITYRSRATNVSRVINTSYCIVPGLSKHYVSFRYYQCVVVLITYSKETSLKGEAIS